MASCAQCESDACHDEQDECAQWAAAGECTANQHFMLTTCPYSCAVCRVNWKPECKRDSSMAPAATRGTVDAVFREAVERFPLLKPKVLSTQPWILLFDEFLTSDEADILLEQ
eukprot:1469931-Pleurochrysis_carterae.AAC.2